MRTPSPTLKEWADLAKTSVEIIAILAAGLWAFSRFRASEAPSLTERVHVENSFTWTSLTDSTYCLVDYNLTLKNIGKTGFDVDTVTLRVWDVPAPQPAERIKLLDPYDFEAGEPALQRVFVRNDNASHVANVSLTGYYPPDITFRDNYTFFVRKNRAMVTVVRLDAWISESGKSTKGFYWTNSNWNWNCLTEG